MILQENRSNTKVYKLLRLSSLMLVLFIALVLVLPASVHATSTKEKLDSARQHLSELESELKNTQTQLNELRSAEKKLSDELSWLSARSAEQNRVYQDALQQKETAYSIMLEDEAAYQQSLQRFFDKQEQYGERISQMYKWQKKSMLEMLLSSDSLQCFFTTVRFMKVISDADEQALNDLESASEEAETMRLRSENSFNELTVLAEEAESVLQQIKSEQAMTQRELDEASYSLSLYQQREENLSAVKEDAQSDVNRYATQYEIENRPTTTTTTRPKTTTTKTQAPTQAPTQAQAPTGGGASVPGGSFAWPVPSSAYITSYYGWRNIFGGTSWHAGIDIAAGYGSNVIAARGGTVTYCGWLGSYGNIVIIDHGDGFSTRYAHLSGFNCHYGQQVSRGQVVGFIGSTGRSTGPHLHFEVLKYGSTVNPLSYY
ncbi:MAG: peptidoglycan DD-metalloendopeptidase family protein [Eubacteriales bacterium]|nr:peptidoglycan DD-metalloendopeptidase family protein [Eubacteriales bacterium]